MANSGTKYVSVNLNKSYGQSSTPFGSTRATARPAAHGGGGMAVLSRPRSSQKAAGPKLSVPPPLNLPSLRKEHERFDSLGSGGGPAGGAGSGSGSRPSSSGLGWTKPAAAALQEKQPLSEDGPRVSSKAVGPATPFVPAAVLRGEDFPSLRATLVTSSAQGPSQNQKIQENSSQKQKNLDDGNVSVGQKNKDADTDVNAFSSSSLVGVNSRFNVPRTGNVSLGENDRDTRGFVSSRGANQNRGRANQEEYFPGPLPLVRLNPRSDWADDERDTSHGFVERSRDGGRDHGFSSSKSDAFWDFDMPRVGVLPQKHSGLGFDKRGQLRGNEAGKVSSSEVLKVDPYDRTPVREGRDVNPWRNSTSAKDGFGVIDAGIERNGVGGRPSSGNRDVGKDNKYIPAPLRDNVYDDSKKRDVGYGQGGKQPWNNTTESYGDRHRHVSNEQNNRNRVDSAQSSVSKSAFSLGGKGLPVNDPLLNFGREKRTLPKNEKSFLEDPFMKDFGGFDGRDPFSSGLVGVVKKKKDVLKQTDFHDPVRESFEAELERVQRMQEQERQRIIEEQERALEFARREEEERLRQAREQEEMQRRLEEEAREAAWRAEQERIEAFRRAEEQRLAREEEKQRMLLEEERRKQAAKQKLIELEQKIARRQAESGKGSSNAAAVVDEKMPGTVNEKDASRAIDVGDWEDSERMVDRILTSASSDSSSVNRPLEMGSRSHFSRDLSSSFVDRGKPVNSWRRDAYENWSSSAFYPHDQENDHSSPRRDSSIGGKPFMRKEYNGGAGFVSSRPFYKGGASEGRLDEYAHVKPQRWNQPADADHLSRSPEMDSDFHENFVDRFGDGWTQSRPRGNPFPPFPERSYQNSESDGPYPLGRSRYSVRQPRVLPPPSLASIHRSYRNGNEHPGPSAFLENEIPYNQATMGDSALPTGYDNGNHGQPGIVDALQETAENEDNKLETTKRCDSQSSLSVSSPPSSPTHLSHDDLDDSGDSPVILTSEESKNGPMSAPENESIATPALAGNENVVTSAAVSSGDDDEWTTENNEQFQEQEEYDDEDYREEDEVHEGDDNANLNRDFEDLHLQEKGLPHLMENLVLGFNEGVQVGMPSEEFERTPKGEETTILGQQASDLTLEEHAPFDNVCNDSKARKTVEDTSQVNLNSSSGVFHDSEKPTSEFVIQPSNTHSSVASESLGNVEATNGPSTHHNTPTSITIAPHYTSLSQSVTSNVAAAPSQAELPIKLQFGLFSGPSLIPSPVPAIQIGSIQMPLHLHPQVGAPLSHMHPSQPPLFQFGQLRYTSPGSQGMMPLGPQSISYVQPNIPSGFSFNHNPGGRIPVQPGPDTSDSFIRKEFRHHSVDGQPGNSRNSSQGSFPSEDAENMAATKHGQAEVSHNVNNITRTSFQLDKQGSQNVVGKSSNSSSNAKESEFQPLTKDTSLHSISKEKDSMESKAQFPVSGGGRGKRYVYTVKTSSSRSSAPTPMINRSDSRGFTRRPNRNIQRTEFRVRESTDKRQSSGAVLTDQFGLDSSKSNFNGRGTGISGRSGPRKAFANKLGKQIVESVGENSHGMNSGSRVEKVDGKESTKIQSISHSGQNNLKRNLCSEEDVDAPLQSGIIRVFEQPGIEAPSDEDDFIEVRSKRQMLNDRREQREKEIKAKSRLAKVPRKINSTSRSTVSMANSSKGSMSTREVTNNIGAHFVAAEVRGMAKMDASSGFNSNLLSQALPPIGTPPLKLDAQPDLRSQTNRSLHTSVPSVSSGEKDPGSSAVFENKNKVQTSLGSWGNVQISQQVMALTQTQLDEAMKPQQFDSQASVGNMTGAVNEPSLPTSSILTKEKTFSSVASPLNSLLAGEKIQFGAVTSPTILPPNSRAVSHGIGPRRSSRPDMQLSHSLAGSDNDCNLFFDKEKHGNESHGHLEDCDAEAEAEAAASAIAVAAIGSDEIVGNGLGTCSVSISDAKSFVATDINRVVAGVSCEQQSASQSRSEEPLSVSLPADLSVETPPISLWPPLPNTQNSSGQMISHFASVPPHFPSGPPSHFPFYEMNPMMGGPMFAFGPHDESASTTQSQPQKSTAPASRPMGNWQQCHSGVESFYGPPTGFTGPFIAPPGGIPGVQGPPHMVVYNHFAPVGQFGQVGLSFMGTTYIPSGKQPDWKHIPTSSAVGAGEGDMNNMNMTSSQRNPANMPSQIQHLAPGSPLLPMASPMAMFDVSPFQPSSDMSVQARWPHVPNAPLSSIPLSMPLHQQEGVQNSQLSHGPSADQPLNVKRFNSSRTSSSDGERSFPRAADLNANQLPDELGLVGTSNSNAAKTSAPSVVNKTSSVTTNSDSAKVDVQNGNGSSNSNQHANPAFKSHPSQQINVSTQQYDHSSGHVSYQRGGTSQRNNSGGEWSHRRMGYQGRNQNQGADKNFPSSKVKQIYVAKQTISGGGSSVS